jgi:hypothetical protein
MERNELEQLLAKAYDQRKQGYAQKAPSYFIASVNRTIRELNHKLAGVK